MILTFSQLHLCETSHIMHGLRGCSEECELGSNMLLSSSSLHDLSHKTVSISVTNLISHGVHHSQLCESVRCVL